MTPETPNHWRTEAPAPSSVVRGPAVYSPLCSISAFCFQRFRFSRAYYSALCAMLAKFRPKPEPVPAQLTLDLDQPTDTGLPLRDALTVRSAEFWIALGEPRLALKELDALSELARQNTWPLRVHLRAHHSSLNPSLAQP